jgi:hypothetical protein
MKNKAIHYVDVVESRTDGAPGRQQCVLDHNITFDKAAIEQATFRPLDDIDIDLLVVISAVSYVDRLIRRRRGTQWSRALVVRVPVHHPETWSRLAGHLSATLRLLSGDAWTFDFRQRQRPQQPQQFLPSLPPSFEGATVIPYSGGLDSFALLARVRHYEPDEKVLLVNARRLVVEQIARPDDVAMIGVPFELRAPHHKEQSYRTRTFKYLALAALVWKKNSGKHILIGESGVGCLGPSLVPVGIEHPVRSSHPDFLHALRALLGQLWATPPPFLFPHLWSTKGMVLAELRGLKTLEGWENTRSCSRNVQRQHPGARGAQCGLCSGCLFRRVSVCAGKLGPEPPETYFEDVFRNAQPSAALTDADRDVARCAIANMDELAGLADQVERRTADIHELAASLQRPVDETRLHLGKLVRVFRDEWRGLLAQLPEASWIHSLTFHGAS